MAINWTKLYKKYHGQWVALKSDERTVVASGKTAQDAWNGAQKKGLKNPILSRMPDRLVPYVGAGWLN